MWNVLLIPLASALGRAWSPRESAMAAALGIAYAQMLVASDAQRLVAAGYPFVLAWGACEFDRWTPTTRCIAGAALVIGQIP
jgi:hypothetical protein